jgi:Pin2-interacting protein X1
MDTQNIAWSRDSNRFGRKLMEKMGWAEGKGLGKNEDGMASHVVVKKRPDQLALGATLDSVGSVGLTSAVENFNSLLASLNAKKHDEEISSDVEKQKKKKSKKEKKERREKPEKIRVGIAYKKRLHSKDASKYSADDLAAILGRK